MMTIDQQLEVIQRGVDEILPLDELKKKLEKMGFILIDPLEWYLEQLPKTS